VLPRDAIRRHRTTPHTGAQIFTSCANSATGYVPIAAARKSCSAQDEYGQRGWALFAHERRVPLREHPERAEISLTGEHCMQPAIYLAFVDDWEVRGNGTGDPRVLQFEPMRRLVKIFNNYGIRGSFNVEVMQQLAYQDLQERFPELKAIADEWEQVVEESFRQGHDIQLHLHPQWCDANYQGYGNWKLDGDWSILNYPSQQIRAMLLSGKQYLESL